MTGWGNREVAHATGISGKISMVQADRVAVPYQQLTESSGAKYKFFIDGGGKLLSGVFLPRTIWACQRHPDVGMIGFLGSKLPAYGNFSRARKIYGAYVEQRPDGKFVAQNHLNPCLEVEDVQNLDPHFIATQYDISWPKDGGDSFFAARKAVHMKQAGYRTCVLEHHGYYIAFEGKSSYDQSFDIPDEQRMQFYDDCGKDVFPLVSILIPAYNQPGFLKDALESALAQDYPNIEIVVGDDITDTRVKDMMEREYLKKYPSIRYYYHGGPLGESGTRNISFLISHANGEYIDILNHDDRFHPNKVSHMMDCFFFDEKQDISIVTSPRTVIDENGKEISRRDDWRLLTEQRVSSEEAAKRILIMGQNFIGEPTTAMFRESALPIDTSDGKPEYAVFCGMRDRGMKDMATWLEILKSGDCVFLPEDLSSFRTHSDMGTFDVSIRILVAFDSLGYLILSWLHGLYLKTEKDWQDACDMWLYNSHAHLTMPEGHKIPDDEETKQWLEQVMEFQMQVAEKKYDELPSRYIEFLLAREDVVDRESLLQA